ncbi:terminase family protein, partial [Candidatus Pacearchaeota archaeon]|nr:terminase family protein [Candidatus Pacearchaeota archaeon]
MDTDNDTFRDYFQKLKKENPRKLAEALTQLSPQDAEDILYDGKIWLRDNQRFDKYDESIILFNGGRGTGKLIWPDTDVLTYNRGWIKMVDIKIGDKVFDEQGNPCNVLEVYEPDISEIGKTYELSFSDKTTIKTCEDHQWTTWTHRDRKQFLRKKENGSFPPKNWPEFKGDIFHGLSKKPVGSYGPEVRTTRDIIDTLHQKTARGDLNHCIPVADPIKFKKKSVPVDAYLYGYWLGDGTKNTSHLTVDKPDQSSFIDECEKVGYKVNVHKCSDKSVLVQGLITTLKEHKMETKQHIPDIYLLNDYNTRLSLLQGFMDSDGFNSGKYIEFCSKTKLHADTVYYLAASLGQRPVLTTGRAMLNGVDHGTKYRVFFTPTINIFRLPRKAAKFNYNDKGSQHSRQQHRMITDAVEIEPVAGLKCITVDSPNHLWLVGKNLIPTHNTFSGAHWVKDLVLNRGVKRVALIGPSIADVRDVMVEGSSGIISVHKPSEAPEYQPSKARVVWPNGAIAKMYSAETPDTIRGGNNEAIWGDEISSWKYDDAFDQAMLTLRVGISQALFTTTPKPNKLMKGLFKRAGKDVRLISGSTYDNLDNLSKAFKEQVISAYENTRLGKQELEGLLLLDVLGALWTTETITKCIVEDEELPEFKKIVVSVDPSGSSAKTADACGITVGALGVDDKVYILKDDTAIM